MAILQSQQIKANDTTRPRKVHAGMNHAFGKYVATAALSAGDVVQMVSVPNGATIHEIKISKAAWRNYTATVGDGAVTDRYQAAISCSATLVVTRGDALTGVGYTYSVGDTIDVVTTAVTSATNSATLIMEVTYSLGTGDIH